MSRMHLIGVFNRAAVTTLLIATSSLIEIYSQSIEFTIEPGDISIPLNSVQNVTFRCSLSDPTLRSHWIVKFPDIMQNLSTRNSNDMSILIERGVIYGSSTITIPGVLENNSTLIRCAVSNFATSTTEFSDPVELTIAGPPLPPDPILVIQCASRLEIRWEIPYSPENYTVESYNIEVVNETSGNVILSIMHQNETSHGIVLEGVEQVMSCHLLTVSVTAVSTVGESESGLVTGGFPIAPQPFRSEVDVDLTFHRDGTPIVEVSFEAPLICDFQTSNYSIIIEDAGSPVVTRQSTYTGGSRSIVEIFDSGLEANRNYNITVLVQDECFEGIVTSNITKLSTAFQPGVESSPTGLSPKDIGIYAGAAAGGGILIVILVSITVVATTLICSRKRRNHSAPGATMDKMLNSNNRADQPDNDTFAVVLPTREITGQGSVYETINEYQEAKKNTMLSRQQQDNQWKLQQLKKVESEREALEDSAYQVMSSASVGDAPDSAGVAVAATSRFSYPQPYPNSPQSPNYPNPAMVLSAMPDQQVLAASAPDPPNTDPYGYDHVMGYQFRPCPASTGAGSSLSPIHENLYDNDASAFDQFHHHPHGFHNQTTMEGELDLNMEEAGDQDYTFMSQAGTLTNCSQTSASGVTDPYLGYGDNDHNIMHHVSVDTAPMASNGAVKVDKNATQTVQYTRVLRAEN